MPSVSVPFLKSILFGYEGSYNFLGTPVEFKNNPFSSCEAPSLEGAGFISQLAISCINSNIFRWLTQSYAHVFAHEMSHALVRKLLTNQNSQVTIFTDSCTGVTSAAGGLISWKRTVISVAGPMGSVAFTICKLVAAVALKNYFSWPVAFVLGAGAILWIFGELLYGCVSVLKDDDGDFGQIARQGKAHLALASAALVSLCALGIFMAIKLAY